MRYTCSLCHEFFTRRDNLDRHLKNSCPGKPPVPKITIDETTTPVNHKMIIKSSDLKTNQSKIHSILPKKFEEEKTHHKNMNNRKYKLHLLVQIKFRRN